MMTLTLTTRCVLTELDRQPTNGSASPQNKALLDHKADIILEIGTSGSAAEDKIAQYREEIDELLLKVLYRRIQVAERFDEVSTAVFPFTTRRAYTHEHHACARRARISLMD